MENQTKTALLLTDLEQAVRKRRIEYSKEITERIEAEIERDKSDKKTNTIRLLRRQVRRLKKQLKAKNSLWESQKSFLEKLNTKEQQAVVPQNIEACVMKILRKALLNGAHS